MNLINVFCAVGFILLFIVVVRHLLEGVKHKLPTQTTTARVCHDCGRTFVETACFIDLKDNKARCYRCTGKRMGAFKEEYGSSD